jgi:hypothetical protein
LQVIFQQLPHRPFPARGAETIGKFLQEFTVSSHVATIK